MMVNLPKEIHTKLKSMSKEISMPMSQCINMLVTEWLKKNEVSKND